MLGILRRFHGVKLVLSLLWSLLESSQTRIRLLLTWRFNSFLLCYIPSDLVFLIINLEISVSFFCFLLNLIIIFRCISIALKEKIVSVDSWNPQHSSEFLIIIFYVQFIIISVLVKSYYVPLNVPIVLIKKIDSGDSWNNEFITVRKPQHSSYLNPLNKHVLISSSFLSPEYLIHKLTSNTSKFKSSWHVLMCGVWIKSGWR